MKRTTRLVALATALAALIIPGAAQADTEAPHVVITSPLVDDSVVWHPTTGPGYEISGPAGDYELGDTRVRATLTDDVGVSSLTVSWTFCKEAVGPDCTPVTEVDSPAALPLSNQYWTGSRDLSDSDRGCAWNPASRAYDLGPCSARWYPLDYPGNYLVTFVARDAAGNTSAPATRRFHRA